MTGSRLTWREPFSHGSGMRAAETAAGVAITAKTVDGDWMVLLRLTSPWSYWIGPHCVARHAAQRWAERALCGGDFTGGTEYPPDEGGRRRGAETPAVPAENGVLSLPTPLARLYGAAMACDIEIADDELDWLADYGYDPAMIAGLVSHGVKITLGPGLDDDGDRADVLAMCLSVAVQMVPRGNVASAGDIIAPSGVVLVTRDREPPTGPIGKIANEIAASCGRDTRTASFAWRVHQRSDDGVQSGDAS